jgi:predicted ester cyclase
MSDQKNKALIHRYIEDAYNQGNLAVIDEAHTADTIHYAPGLSAEPMRGTEALKQGVAAWRDAFPDFHVTLDDLIAEGDEVAYRWTARGTHQGEFRR